MNAAKESLLTTFRALSSPADAQVSLFPADRCVPCALSNLFMWWSREFHAELRPDELTDRQREFIDRVSEAGEEAARSHPCHENEAIRAGKAFAVLRQTAADALAEFGWEPGALDPQFIPGTAEHTDRCERAVRDRKQRQRAARRPGKARLRYHRALFEAIGVTPAISQKNEQLLREREQILGFSFPAAIFELLSVEGIADLVREYSNADELVTNDEFDEWKKLAMLGDPTEIKQGYLRVAVENQGVVAYFVPLDGAADPPVFHNNDQWYKDLSAVEWVRVSDHFSTFILALMGITGPS